MRRLDGSGAFPTDGGDAARHVDGAGRLEVSQQDVAGDEGASATGAGAAVHHHGAGGLGEGSRLHQEGDHGARILGDALARPRHQPQVRHLTPKIRLQVLRTKFVQHVRLQKPESDAPSAYCTLIWSVDTT